MEIENDHLYAVEGNGTTVYKVVVGGTCLFEIIPFVKVQPRTHSDREDVKSKNKDAESGSSTIPNEKNVTHSLYQ
ncbi:hypothetical protein FQA39_LY05373 [Lamprigera yunnana]|nr:hypothetical protein FQA39_LY05373 [Lamprigera yunnana]